MTTYKIKCSFLLVGFMLCCMNAFCASLDTWDYLRILDRYSNALNQWSHHKDDRAYGDDIFLFSNKKGRVSTQFTEFLLSKYPISGVENNAQLSIESFLSKIESWFDDHENHYLRVVDTKVVREEDMDYADHTRKKGKDNYVVVTGKLQIVSADDVVLQEFNEQYYINVARKKIQFISTYEEVIVNGKRKVRVDFSKLKEETTLGGSVNYSPDWPLSLSFGFSTGYFMLDIDGGLNLDDDVITQTKLEMTDILNYQKTTTLYNPLYYVTATPSVYLKYFSIGCGVGIMGMSKEVIAANRITQSNFGPVRLMLRPKVKGFIPLNDKWYFSLNASYDYVPAVDLKNGFSFGVGLQYRLY